MDEDNGNSQRASWTSLKRSHSNPNLSDERVLNEGSRRGSIGFVRDAEFSRSAGHSPNHNSSSWNPMSDQTDLVMTSARRPILKPIESQDGLASPHSDPDDTYLSISMHPAQDFGLVVDDSDEFTASLRPLLKYTEGDYFDLQGISSFLHSPDPNLQCAALQMLEHAAEWESTNFTERMPVTFGPVSQCLDSKNLQVHCAALDTLKLFLASPHATDIQSMIPRVATAVFNDLSSSEPLVRMGSVELLKAAAQSEEILVEFAAAISHISSILPSMPTATQVATLGVLEVSARSNLHDLMNAVADTVQSFTQALFSPETTVQIAVLGVLEAGLGAKSKELCRAVTAVFPFLTGIISFGKPDVQTVARRVLGADIRPVALNEAHMSSTDSLLSSTLQHSQSQLPDQEYGPFSQTTISALSRKTDIYSPHPLGAALNGHFRRVQNVAPLDNERIVSASDDDSVIVWNLRTEGQEHRWYHEGAATVAVSPDGNMIVNVGRDRAFQLWGAESGNLLSTPWEPHKGRVWSVAWPPDGSRIASRSADNSLILWNARLESPSGEPFLGSNQTRYDVVCAVAYCPKGEIIATCGYDSTIKIWDDAGGLHTTLIGHTECVLSVVWTKDGNRIISGSADGTVRVWDLEQQMECATPAHTGAAISSVAVSDHVYAAASANKIFLWNLKTPQHLNSFELPESDEAYCVALTPNEATLIACTERSGIYTFDIGGGWKGRPGGRHIQWHR